MLWIIFTAALLFGQRAGLETSYASIQDDIASGDLAAASRKIDDALAQSPNEGGLFNLRGIVHAKHDRLEAARGDFETAVQLAPTLVPARQNLARSCQLLVDRSSSAMQCAMDSWQTVLKSMPKDTEAILALATLHEWRGEFAQSLRELNRLPESDAPALALRCADLAGIGAIDKARMTLDALARLPNFSETEAEIILPVLEKSKNAGLIVQLVEALDSRNLASVANLRRLAAAYEHLSSYKEARKTLERVAAAEPNQKPDLLELARIAYLSHDPEGALGYLAHARDLSPNDPQIHFLFGMIAVQMDLPIEARRSLERALELNPAGSAYHYALGSIILTTRDAASAVAHFQSYVAALPADPRGHFALGVAYFASGDYTRADTEMHTAAIDATTAAGAEYFMGRIDLAGDRLDQAAEHFDRSIHLLPAFAESYTQLARVRMRQGRLQPARAALDKALAIDPDSYQANTALLALYQRTRDSRKDEQTARLRTLDERRSAKAELMLRTIEVKPY